MDRLRFDQSTLKGDLEALLIDFKADVKANGDMKHVNYTVNFFAAQYCMERGDIIMYLVARSRMLNVSDKLNGERYIN